MKKTILSIIFSIGMISNVMSVPFLVYARNAKGGGLNGYDYVHKIDIVVWPWEFVDILCKDPGNESCPTSIGPNDAPSLSVEEHGIVNNLVEAVDDAIEGGDTEGEDTQNFLLTTNVTVSFLIQWYIDGNGFQVINISKYQ